MESLILVNLGYSFTNSLNEFLTLIYDLFMLVLLDVGVMIFKWNSLIVMACLGIHLKIKLFYYDSMS